MHSTYYFVAPKCQHNTFTWFLPKKGLGESIEEWRESYHSTTSHVTCHKFDTFPFTITYITGHLNEHAPTSVTFEINLPNARSYRASGRPVTRREGCKLVSYEGGHEFVKRSILDEAYRRVMDLQRWAIGKSTFDYRVVQDCLFTVAVILQKRCLGAGLLVAKMEQDIGRSTGMREKKRGRVVLYKKLQAEEAS